MEEGRQTYGGARRYNEVTLSWLNKVQADKEHWYLILGQDGICYSADDYMPTTEDSLKFYREVFGREEDLPPYYQKIADDFLAYYNYWYGE